MNPTFTRREMLAAVAAATTAAALGTRARAAAPTTQPAAPSAQPLPAEPFALTDVRLLAGPFKDAQDRDATYLRSLEPDRMMHNFRVNAGLQPKAPVYGGWESVAMWADIRAQGHTLGHYLSACAMMYASTEQAEFQQRCKAIVADLAECQAAGKTGLVCAFPDGAKQLENAIAGRRVIGVPWYTMHKIFAGLRDAYEFAGVARGKEVLIKLADWAVEATAPMTDEAFERMLRVEHGGMNEVLADLFAWTGDRKYLTLAQRFCHKAILEPLAAGKDALDGLHSNTQIPKIVGFARLYQLTGETRMRDAATFFWKTVTATRSFATGGNGDNEHFFPVNEFARHVTSAKTMETCCSHNMLKLTRLLFSLDPQAEYAAYYERTLYNTILASQDPDSGMMTYFQPTRPGYLKLYCTPIDSFWCCTGTGMENHAKYGDSLYFHSPEGAATSLYVNLFVPSTLRWKEQGLTLAQATRFPDEPRTRLQITAEKPVQFTLHLRQPAWCSGMVIKVNGEPVKALQSDGYLAIQRSWKSGDSVEVEVPMDLNTVPLPGAADQVAFTYGPLVLVGLLGKAGITPGSDVIVNERTYGQVLNEAVEVPTVATDLGHIKPGSSPLEFSVAGTKGGAAVEVPLRPYFRVAHERYNMYWKRVLG